VPRYDDYDDDPPDRYRDDEPWERPKNAPHSWLGISSILIGVLIIVAGLVTIGVCIAAGIDPDTLDENDPQAMLIGVALIGLLIGCFVGLGLGVAGAFQPNRNKLLPGLGIGLNGILTIMMMALFCLGVIGMSLDSM
jgi:hypothetical protein